MGPVTQVEGLMESFEDGARDVVGLQPALFQLANQLVAQDLPGS